jgi:two-component system cell cycle sensor histidine kinase/response regulator CckA
MNMARPIHVLLVEDSPTDVLLAQDALEGGRTKFQVENVPSLAQAMDLLHARAFDVALLDLGLPDSQGLDTLRRICDVNSDLPVVVMTGNDDEELSVQAVHEGAQDYLVKGQVQNDLLVRTIRHAIERSGLRADLRRRDAEWRTISQAGILGVYQWTMDGAFTQANDTFLKWVGYSEDDLACGKVRWADMTPPEYRGLVEKSIQEVRATGKWTPYEKEFTRKDGSRIQIMVGGMLFEGSKELGVGFAIDLTEKKKADETTATLRAIIEGSDDAIIGTTLDGIVLAWNPGAARLYGYEAPEIMGRHISVVCPPDLADEMRGTMDQVKAGNRVPQFETTRRRKDGKRIDVAVSLSPVRDGQGRIVAVSKIAHDITEKRRLEEQFRQAQKMEAVGRLAGGVAHDFNNLLTIISGYSEIVEKKLPAGDPVRELVREIRKAGERAAGLTRQLLSFSRKTVLQPGVLDLNVVLADSLKMLGRLVGEDVEVATVLASSLGRVKIDPGQFDQAIVNLAVNARDAMPQGGKLTFETMNIDLDANFCRMNPGSTPGLHVMLAVSDTGSGMSEETRARIFEPFFTTKEPGKGTGLGLAMVYGFIQQSGGHIAVSSELNHGTTFKLYFPQVREAVRESKSHPGLRLMPNGAETILLVEDEDGVRALARHVLQMSGYMILEARDGGEALRLAQRHPGPIHLLLTDVVMPGIGGRLVSERLAALKPGVKTLFMSGYTDDAVVRHGILETETHFLQKPYTPAALAQKVREVLDG